VINELLRPNGSTQMDYLANLAHDAIVQRAYAKFVLQLVGLSSPLLAAKRQLLFGDDAIIKQLQSILKEGDLRELSIAHKRILALSLAEYSEQITSRSEAMVAAYRSGAYTMAELAQLLMENLG
jgi:putative transposase